MTACAVVTYLDRSDSTLAAFIPKFVSDGIVIHTWHDKVIYINCADIILTSFATWSSRTSKAVDKGVLKHPQIFCWLTLSLPPAPRQCSSAHRSMRSPMEAIPVSRWFGTPHNMVPRGTKSPGDLVPRGTKSPGSIQRTRWNGTPWWNGTPLYNMTLTAASLRLLFHE